MSIPKKVRERILAGYKSLQQVIVQQKARDVSEADTVTLVKDLFASVLGYDKYSELTSEFAIRGTYCDLAIKLGDELKELVEVKAIGITLEDRHVKQAIDYAANQGIEWVILTNAVTWRLYEVIFGKPIEKRLLIEIDLLALDLRKDEDIEKLYLLTKEGFLKGAHLELRDRQDATNRFLLAALILNDEDILCAIRRELRRVVDVLVDEREIASVLRNEVIKRDVLEGPAAEEALKRIIKTAKAQRKDEKASKPVTEVLPTEPTKSASVCDSRTVLPPTSPDAV